MPHSFTTPWTVARQAPLSMGFPRQECWSGLPFPFPGDLPNPGIKPRSPALQADSLPAEPQGKPDLVFPSLENFSTVVIHTVKGFGVVNKAEVDVFPELSCFFNDSTDVGNLISGSSVFSKSSLNIRNFTVHVLLKPGLENFKHYITSV